MRIPSGTPHLGLLSILVLIAVGCGGKAADGASSPDTTPAGSPSASTPTAGEGATGCQEPLTTFLCPASSVDDKGWCCPESFDGSPAPVVCDGSLSHPDQSRGTCPGIFALRRDWGTHGISCYYSSSTHALSGAVMNDDINSFCSRTNYIKSGGEVPASCPLTPHPAGEGCPLAGDAGAD